MKHDTLYKVRWILAPVDHDRGGFFGTTSHAGTTPAAAAVASAESILQAVDEDDLPLRMLILGVYDEDERQDLLSQPELAATLRCHDTVLPCEVVHRPLC